MAEYPAGPTGGSGSGPFAESAITNLTADLAANTIFPRVILSRQAGIDPTGATDCAAALQTVINATATAGKQLLWDCKILTSATVITLPTNTDIVGCGWSTSQLIGGWTLTSTGGYYVTNADRNGGNTGIRVSNLQITGAGDGTPWGNATNPVTGFALAHCSDFEISRVRAYHIPGISFSGQSCFHGKWDVDVYGSGRDGLNNTYIGGEMHDLTVDISAYLVGDDGVTVNSSPTGGPLNGTAVTVATTAGSNAIIASAPTSPGWTTGQSIVIAGAASGGLALEATLNVVDSTHATLMVPGGTESTVGIPAVLSVGAASAWYGVYRPYNVVIRSFDIYGAPATVTQGAGRGIYIAGSDVTLGDGVINSTYSSGIRIQSDFVTTALYSKVTAGNVTIRNAGQVGGGTSTQPRDGINIDGGRSVEFSSLRIDGHYARGLYATHCVNLQCSSAHISNGGQASTDFGIDLDGITGTNYQVDTVNLDGLIVESQSGNGIRCNMARRVKINGTIKNNGRLKAGSVNDWGILYIGDATTEATISGIITDTQAAGQKTQLGSVFIQTPGAPFVVLTNLIAYGNTNTDISSTGAAVVLRRNVLCHGTILTANYDQDSTGAKHYTAPSSPQGVISAPVGSTYRQTDGTVAAMFWTKTSGSGNTGWTPLSPSWPCIPLVGVAGQYSVPQGSTQSISPVVNVERCYPVVFKVVPNNATAVGLWVVTTTALAVVRLGLRADAGLAYPYPGTLIADFGTVDAHTATGWVEITAINRALTADTVYWLTATQQAAAATLVGTSASNAGFVANSNASLVGSVGGYSQSAVSGALPSPFAALGSGGGETSAVPRVLFKF